MAAPSQFLMNYTHGTVKLLDGTGTPLVFTFAVDQGDFSIDGLAQRLREVVAYSSRGALRGVALGDRTYPTLSMSAMIKQFKDTDAGEGTVFDFISGTAGTDYAARISTLGAAHPVFCCDVDLTVTDYAGAPHTIQAHDVALTYSIAEGDPDTCNLSGIVYGQIEGDVAIDG